MKNSNNIKYTAYKIVSGERIEVSITLNDECNNGHEDFAITGDIYKHTETFNRSDRYYIAGGCIHETILEHFPQFAVFVHLHLSDFEGAPMYAVANGFYHIKQGKKDAARRHFRTTEVNISKLMEAGDEKHLKYLIQSLGIDKEWRKQAKEAIALLESLRTDDIKFKSTATRRHFEPFTEKEMKEMQEVVESGYYLPENVEKRKKEEEMKKKAELLDKLNKRFDARLSSMNKELRVKRALIDMFGAKDNYIYYNHSSKLVFNWKSWADKFTEEEVKAFLSANMDALQGICVESNPKS